MMRIEKLLRVRANALKTDIAHTYAAADREPVAIVKGQGRSPDARVTHVLMSAQHYRGLTEGEP